MDFQPDPDWVEIGDSLIRFIDSEVLPLEHEYRHILLETDAARAEIALLFCDGFDPFRQWASRRDQRGRGADSCEAWPRPAADCPVWSLRQ